MIVWVWIALAAYLIGWAGFSVTIARFLQKDPGLRAEDTVEATLLIAMSMAVAVLWPLVIPGGWIYLKVFG